VKATATALLVVAGLSLMAQAAEPATLTLACQGTATDITLPVDGKPEPVSMGSHCHFGFKRGTSRMELSAQDYFVRRSCGLARGFRRH
jgi:hypothetical protein